MGAQLSHSYPSGSPQILLNLLFVDAWPYNPSAALFPIPFICHTNHTVAKAEINRGKPSKQKKLVFENHKGAWNFLQNHCDYLREKKNTKPE